MDISNIVICLPNGTKVDWLHFCYKMLGSILPDFICICNLRRKDKSKKDCDFSTNTPVDTLVPRFAAHLVWMRSNTWDEVFGRVPMNGIMATVLTSPSSTQGRVLHPTQNRMCSSWEFARAQGSRIPSS
jgi:hypothetical protein